MNINERIKDFRKNVLHLSQTEFATQLGMKQTSVSTFEKSGATVTDPTIKAQIGRASCRERVSSPV